MDPAKIRLSKKEMELLIDPQWILTKNGILKKGWHLLEHVQSIQEIILNETNNLPESVKKTTAKISKGENYRGLPYLILDQPRFFKSDNVLAIRTMFWWGNFISVTLHIAGDMKVKYEQHLKDACHTLKEKDFFICINDDMWEHHFGEDNYQSASGLDIAAIEKIIVEKSFVKIAQKIPLEKWDEAIILLPAMFQKMLEMISPHSTHSAQ
jgi:hypothetical protein